MTYYFDMPPEKELEEELIRSMRALQPHKGGFDIRDGHTMSREEELRILEENGFKIDMTPEGILITK